MSLLGARKRLAEIRVAFYSGIHRADSYIWSTWYMVDLARIGVEQCGGARITGRAPHIVVDFHHDNANKRIAR
jgi:hypothetical protein